MRACGVFFTPMYMETRNNAAAPGLSKCRGEVSSCWMSVFHGIITTVLSTYEV